MLKTIRWILKMHVTIRRTLKNVCNNEMEFKNVTIMRWSLEMTTIMR